MGTRVVSLRTRGWSGVRRAVWWAVRSGCRRGRLPDLMSHSGDLEACGEALQF